MQARPSDRNFFDGSVIYTELGEIPRLDQAWGAPVEITPRELVTENPTLEIPALISDKPKENPLAEAITKLKEMALSIEEDIAYYRKFKGQSMAINHLCFYKIEVLETLAKLEKVCLSQ